MSTHSKSKQINYFHSCILNRLYKLLFTKDHKAISIKDNSKHHGNHHKGKADIALCCNTYLIYYSTPDYSTFCIFCLCSFFIKFYCISFIEFIEQLY